MTTKEVMSNWQRRPQQLVASFIKERLHVEVSASTEHLDQPHLLGRFTSYEDEKRTLATSLY